MFQITINEKGGQAKSLDFDKTEITIGRVQGNDIVLPKGNISKRHSRIVLKDGKFIIIDMQSTNGTYVNGKKITTPQVVKSTDKIYIGDFTLQLSSANGALDAPPAAAKRGATAAEPDLDLGDAPGDEASEPARGGGGAAAVGPGLIDDNFDQEFEGTAEPPGEPARTAAPARATPANTGRSKKPEPTPPPEPELDLDLGGGEASEPQNGGMGEMDFGNDMPEEPPEPEPPKVVPMQKKAPEKKAPVPAPAAASTATGASRPNPARLKPVPGKPKKEEMPPLDDAQEDTPSPVVAKAPEPPPSLPPQPVTAQSLTTASLAPSVASQSSPPPPQIIPMGHAPMYASAGPAPSPLSRTALVDKIQLTLIEDLGLRGVSIAHLHERQADAEQAARRMIDRWRSAGLVSGDDTTDQLVTAGVAAAIDVEQIRELFEDETVLEIVVSPAGEILAEREGQLGATERRFGSEGEVVALIRRLALLAGATVDGPLVDVRMRDGARLVASLPPLSFRGPTLSLRKTTREAFTLDALAQQGTLSDTMQRLIEYSVRYRRGALLVVGPGVGASATLNAIASIVPVDERVVTIESGVEVHVLQTHAIALEPSATMGLDRLIQHAIALQPDRAIIGHLTGDKIASVVSAIAGPLEGSVACYAGSSAEHAVDRLAHEMAGANGATDRARQIIARAFPLVLVEHRFADGSRRITEMSEVRADAEGVVVEPVFVFEVEGVDGNGLISGTFKATGHRPRFLEELNDRGLEVDMSIFSV